MDNRISSFEIPPKSMSPKEANRSTTAILIKLLATRMVANNLLGFCNSFSILLIFLGYFSLCSSISEGVNEKKATSAPDINADPRSKKASRRIFKLSIDGCSEDQLKARIFNGMGQFISEFDVICNGGTFEKEYFMSTKFANGNYFLGIYNTYTHYLIPFVKQ